MECLEYVILPKNKSIIAFVSSYQRTLHRNLSYLTQFDMTQSHHPNTLPVCSFKSFGIITLISIF
jgi:hypothetical protein